MNSTPTETITSPIPDHILTGFLEPKHAVLNAILAIWNVRGDLTQSGSTRDRLAMGEERFEHYNWDTAVSNGRVLLVLPRYKHPQANRPLPGFHFPAEWWWCFDQIELQQDIEIAPPALVMTVPEDLRASLSALPELEWIQVQRINYSDNKPKSQPAPKGILFFRFKGGLGLSVAPVPVKITRIAC